MNENLKIDVIYYEVMSDFAFEFNLGGYCRCRVLTADADSQKELVNCLAKAVSRSRIIILTGQLEGETGLVDLVAKAISANVVPVDKASFGIKDDAALTMLEGGVPLVTSKGQFGGCIAESGPQSMILLTNDTKVRAAIMEELVSTYITTISQTDDAENNLINKTENDPPDAESDPVPSHTDTIEIPMSAGPENDSVINAMRGAVYLGESIELPETAVKRPAEPMPHPVELPADMPVAVPLWTGHSNKTIMTPDAEQNKEQNPAPDQPAIHIADLPTDTLNNSLFLVGRSTRIMSSPAPEATVEPEATVSQETPVSPETPAAQEPPLAPKPIDIQKPVALQEPDNLPAVETLPEKNDEEIKPAQQQEPAVVQTPAQQARPEEKPAEEIKPAQQQEPAVVQVPVVKEIHVQTPGQESRDADPSRDIYSAEDISSEPLPDDPAVAPPTKKSKLSVAIIIMLCLLAVVLAVLAYLIFYVPGLHGYTTSEYIRELLNTAGLGGLL